MAVRGVGLLAAPIIGPTVGGYITDNWNWRWDFYINVPLGMFAAFMVSTSVNDPPYMKKFLGKGLADYLGIACLVVSLGLGDLNGSWRARRLVLDPFGDLQCRSRVAPYGPEWLPGDYPEDITLTIEAQVQKAVDCYNAGATLLHLHVRDPKTGHGSKNLQDFSDQIARIRKAVPKLLIQVGGSISFAPLEGGDKAKWLNYDTRHILTELTPKPDQVTIAINIVQMNVTEIMTQDDIAGPRWQTQKCSRPTARW